MDSWNWFWYGYAPKFEPTNKELVKFLRLLKGFSKAEKEKAEDIWNNMKKTNHYGEYTNFISDIKRIIGQPNKSNSWKLKKIRMAADNITKWWEEWNELVKERKMNQGWDKPWPPKFKNVNFSIADKCVAMMCADGIITRKTFRDWLVANHPDSCGKNHSGFKSQKECEQAKDKIWKECHEKMKKYMEKNMKNKKQISCSKTKKK